MSDGSNYNAAERRDVRRAEKSEKLWSKDRAELLRRIMGGAPGRRWTLEILEACHVFGTTFTGDALSSAFSEGERNVGLRILADVMSACPDQYIQMMREKNARDSTPDPDPDQSDFDFDAEFDASSEGTNDSLTDRR